MRSVSIPRIEFRRLPNLPLILIPVSLLLAYYVGKSAVYPQPNLWFLVAFLFLVIALTRSAKAGILVILISVFLLDWLSKTFLLLPRQLTWLKDASVLILLMRTLAVTAKEKEVPTTPIDIYVFLFLMVGFFSMVANAVSPIVVALGFRPGLKYILLFYVIVNSHFEEKFLRKVFAAFLAIAFVQIPITILENRFWYVAAARLPGGAINRWDFVTGTLPRGGSGVLGIFIGSAICILIGFSICYKDKLKSLLGAALLFIPLPLTVARASFLMLPAAVSFMLLRKTGGRLALRIVCAVLIASFFFASMYLGSSAVGLDLVSYVLNPLAAVKAHMAPVGPGRVGRISGIRYVFDYLGERPYGYLLGVGPGVWSESFFGGFSGELWSEFEDMPVSNINQISAILGEFGVLGLILFLLMIFQVYRMNEEFSSKVKDDFWKSVSFGFSGIIFLYCMATIYVSVWYSDALAFWFWFFAAAIFCMRRRIES